MRDKILRLMEEKGHQIEIIELGKNDAFPCLGCLLCLTKHPGQCVNHDIVSEIRRNIQSCGMTIFLTPVLFGHFSSCIKNAMDRGAGSHHWQIIIGFGSDIDDEEKSTFIDLTAKHRGSVDVVHPRMDKQVDVFVTRSIEENAALCEAVNNSV